MLEALEHTTIVNLGGLLIGLLFGAVGQRSGFCLTRGLQRCFQAGDGRKLRSFVLAMVTALLGTQLLASFGLVDLSRSLYLGAEFSWLLVPLGGVLFGYGMVMANGCGARATVLLGSGNLRAFVVLTCLGVAAFMALTGVFAQWRLAVADLTSMRLALGAGLDAWLASAGLPGWLARWLMVTVLAVPLVAFVLADRRFFRQSRGDWLAGVLIGLLVPAGWWVTGYLGADDFDPVAVVSLTFVAPIGDSIQYLMLASGTDLGFGVTVVAGILLGSLASALLSGTFRLEGFSHPLRMLRYMGGGALMGIGGALALGCSIGQGITGLSTLALPSLFAAAGIVLGGFLALRGPTRLPPI